MRTKNIAKYYKNIFFYLDFIFMPFLLLVIRLWMASIFWNSGYTKIQDWDDTVGLFRDVYNTPYFTPELAAILTTSFELLCPVLLIMGLATRVAVIPMLIIIAVIQFTFMSSDQHFYWAVIFLTLLFKGAGLFSMDYLIARKYQA